MKKKKSLKEVAGFVTPHMSDGQTFASTTNSRRNVAGTIEKTDRFKNIDDGLVPFRFSSNYGSNSSVDIRDAVILCQKCYYNFAIFRNIIDLMTEFSVNNIFYRGGNKKSRDFFSALFDKINLWDLQDKFFREYYRSGNVFIYRFDTKIDPADVSKVTQIYGDVDALKPDELTIPNRYIILNPADIQLTGSANFAFGAYYKVLTAYEINQLKNPKTQEDIETLNSLDPKIKEKIQKGGTGIIIPLDLNKIAAIFYKKQDYEPFSVPMGYPVLELINAKAEMMKIDMAICRTAQQMIFILNHGYEGKDGSYQVNPKNGEILSNLFNNNSVSRTLVADFSVKGEWKVPQIGDILTPEKYTILDNDINIGLNNVFVGGEKFANQAQKVEIFIARLQQAREAFLNNFLIPEIKRIAKSVGMQKFPTPYFEDIELKDTTNSTKNYIQMLGMGALTPEQCLKAIETGTLPDPDLMEENQKSYKEQRDAGLYEPLVGGKAEPAAGSGAGRPSGAKAPKKITPIGGGPKKVKASELKFSLSKIKDNLILAEQLEEKVLAILKVGQGVKKATKLHKEVATKIAHLIVANEEPKDWESNIEKYSKLPVDQNPERVNQIIAIAAEHQIDNDFLASILLSSIADQQSSVDDL